MGDPPPPASLPASTCIATYLAQAGSASADDPDPDDATHPKNIMCACVMQDLNTNPDLNLFNDITTPICTGDGADPVGGDGVRCIPDMSGLGTGTISYTDGINFNVNTTTLNTVQDNIIHNMQYQLSKDTQKMNLIIDCKVAELQKKFASNPFYTFFDENKDPIVAAITTVGNINTADLNTSSEKINAVDIPTEFSSLKTEFSNYSTAIIVVICASILVNIFITVVVSD